MKKQIITISRQCGSGGHTIGEMISQKTGLPLYDKKLIKQVAQKTGLSEEIIEKTDECTSLGQLFSVARNVSYGYNFSNRENMPLTDQINAFQSDIIRELATTESCIIVGRCADYILRDAENAFHVFISGDVEERAKRAVAEYGISEAEAVNHVLDRDKKRARHYKYVTGQEWGMAQNYDLCLNSSHFSLDKCIELILNDIK